MELFSFWAIMIYLILVLLLFIVLYPLYLDYRNMRGRPRMISGEILSDIGISLLVGAGLKWGLLDISYYVVIGISLFIIIIGVRMKYDKE